MTSHHHSKYAAMLKHEGFSAAQSEAIVSLIAEAIHESLQGVQRNTVPKTALKSFMTESQADFEVLRSELKTLEKKGFAQLKIDLAKIAEDVARIHQSLDEEVRRTHGSVRLDVNLEKARKLDEAQGLERLVDQADGKIVEEIGMLTKRLEQMKLEMKTGLRTFFIGVIGLFGTYKLLAAIQDGDIRLGGSVSTASGERLQRQSGNGGSE
ncbi:hypothetical protein HDV05_003013 [Chytridiales sp. JEL 0842]|nr:hypothetical protein HDV05_003013 [Chytridiales sp. JEL 0842]